MEDETILRLEQIRREQLVHVRRLADSLDLIVVMLRDDCLVRTLREETAMRLYVSMLSGNAHLTTTILSDGRYLRRMAAIAWRGAEYLAQAGEDNFVDLSDDTVGAAR